ncbi:hypothetical protein ORIO_02225 [Cereibacter azotoformans]|uniref:Uncharacterized protein n=1 Tax=Cereibacter sphaeroides (strain ATCC 17025 / ATH 2.4.3) TaxID=349102 RepID=A4WPN7_CERS5|nr:hypothetical protein [Cereibacter azotoformans]ULB08753.1 hypothetical protein ORIO_02225 [Cereibacter azotoformans]
MTIDTATPSATYTISGIGPYGIDWPYTAGSVQVGIGIAGLVQPLDPSYWSLTPSSTTTSGNLYLTEAAATTYAGMKLVIERETLSEQGWAGVLGEREKGLEAQLDTIIMAQQEMRDQLARSLRLPGAIKPFLAAAGCALIFDATGQPIAGPTIDEISNAQGYAIAAYTSAAAVAGYASAAAGSASAAGTAAEAAETTLLNGVRSGDRAAMVAAVPLGVMRRIDAAWAGDYAWDDTVTVAQHTASPELFIARDPAADGAWAHTTGSRKGNTFFAPTARVHRFNDRVLIGDAAASSATTVGTPGSTWSWLSLETAGGDTKTWMESNGRTVSATEFGLALVGAARINPAHAASRSVFGVTGIVRNDGLNPGLTARAWAGYLEAHHIPQAGKVIDSTTLFEFQIANYDQAAGDPPPLTPFGNIPYGTAHGGTIGSGVVNTLSDYLAPVSWALRLEGTGSQFMSGIVFRSDVLKAWGDGKMRAVLMARNQNLSWWDGTDEVAQIQVSSQTAANAMKLDFNNSGLSLENATGQVVAFFNKGPHNASKYLSLAASASSGEPEIRGVGVQANVDVALVPKGSGLVRFGTLTANADAAITGYISIKDASGTLRKLAVIS